MTRPQWGRLVTCGGLATRLEPGGRISCLTVLLLVALGSARIVSTYKVFSHTIDEPDTLAAGIEYLSTGKYRYEDTHPPLARVLAALGPYLAGERFHPGPDAYFEGYRILGRDAHYDRILALARAGILPFFWMGAAVVYLWARRLRGPAAGVAAVLVYTTVPPVLAHAGLATTDMALGATVPAAALAWLYWLERPGRRRGLLLGALVALACLSKFSAILFLPAGCVAMWAVARDSLRRPPAKAVALALAAAALTIWAAYGFSFARVEFLHLRLPAPRFFSGIHAVYVHNRAGHPAYLLGRRSANGFWYYFPVVLSLKTPLALLALAAVALGMRNRAGAAAPLAFAAGVLAVSMTGRIDLGVRYLLPVYAGLAVVAGCVAVAARGTPARTAIATLLAWQVISGARQHPDYLAYTNELAGAQPERLLADSDLDWGQDMNRLSDFMARRGVTRLTFTPFNRTYLWAGHALPQLDPGDTDHPNPGWNAVSITLWKVFGFPQWPDRAGEPQRIGKSILVWEIKPSAVSGQPNQ